VPRFGSQLQVRGDDFVALVLDPPNGDLGPGPLVIEVQRIIHARVDASSIDPLPDAFCILDEEDESIPLYFVVGQTRGWQTTLSLEAGVSGVFTVPETAATLVLMRGDLEDPEELSRHAITLVPGDVNVLAP